MMRVEMVGETIIRRQQKKRVASRKHVDKYQMNESTDVGVTIFHWRDEWNLR